MNCVVFQNYQEVQKAYTDGRLGSDIRDEKCPICFDKLQTNEKNVSYFGHKVSEGDRIWHLEHEHCKTYAVVHEKCPICMDSLDTRAIASLRERVLTKIQELSSSTAKRMLSTTVPFVALAVLVNQASAGYFPDAQLGTIIGGLAIGYSSVVHVLNMQYLRNNSTMQFMIDFASIFAPPMLYDMLTAGDDSYSFYGATVLPPLALGVQYITGYRILI